ncbi:hypothetical protein A2U01_0063107, partial [Trifolium medium]|nr:hypothetical protein [Trifolium medium]
SSIVIVSSTIFSTDFVKISEEMIKSSMVVVLVQIVLVVLVEVVVVVLVEVVVVVLVQKVFEVVVEM